MTTAAPQTIAKITAAEPPITLAQPSSVVVAGALVPVVGVGAGAVVTGKMNAPDGSLILGSPAKVVRALTAEEIQSNYENAKHYAEKRELYR